jgi:hypothetical protein
VPGQRRGSGGETPLRAADLDDVPGEKFTMAGGEAVDGMSLWHSRNLIRERSSYAESGFAHRGIAG